jgi:hypothetical protein
VEVRPDVVPLVEVAAADVAEVLAAGALRFDPDDLATAGVADVEGERAALLTDGAGPDVATFWMAGGLRAHDLSIHPNPLFG